MNIFDLRKAADVSAADSWANRLRKKRFALFESLIATLPQPVRIIDVGGTLDYWRQRGWVGRPGVEITVVNLGEQEYRVENILVKFGNATNLSEFSDNAFDVAYSNSVIEHLFTYQNQVLMADEIRRIARAYWVQTPNYWFPLEPHFLIPGWQWLPRELRVKLLMRYRCGWNGPTHDRHKAEDIVDEHRLMRESELRHLFPTGKLWREKFFGLTKSLTVYDGFMLQNNSNKLF